MPVYFLPVTPACLFIFYFFFFNSVLRPFQDYFSSYETGQSVGGAKTGEPREKTPLFEYITKQTVASTMPWILFPKLISPRPKNFVHVRMIGFPNPSFIVRAWPKQACNQCPMPILSAIYLWQQVLQSIPRNCNAPVICNHCPPNIPGGRWGDSRGNEQGFDQSFPQQCSLLLYRQKGPWNEMSSGFIKEQGGASSRNLLDQKSPLFPRGGGWRGYKYLVHYGTNWKIGQHYQLSNLGHSMNPSAMSVLGLIRSLLGSMKQAFYKTPSQIQEIQFI